MRRIWSSVILGMGVITILISTSLLNSCARGNTAFFDYVLNDFDSSSYFVALNVRSPEFSGRVIIENNYLFRYLNETRKLNKLEYRSFMKKVLVHNRKLKITDKDLLKWNFVRLTDMESVMRVTELGKNGFIAHYFDGTVLNYGVTDQERNAIINQLFYWDVPSKIDKLTGSLIIG